MEIKEQVTPRTYEEYLSLKDIMKIIIRYLILMQCGIGAVVMLMIAGLVRGDIGEWETLLTSALTYIIIIPAIGRYLKSRKTYSQKNCFKLSYKMIVYIVILGIGGQCAVSSLFEVLLPHVPESVWMWPSNPSDTFENYSNIEIFVIACIIAPIAEEWIFRGYFLKGLSHGYNKVTAILVSSLLFGLIHMNLSQFIAGLILGGILGLLYLRYESLGGCILLHSFYNFLAITDYIPLALYIIGIIALVVAVYMLWKEVRTKDYTANDNTAEDTIPIEQIPK